ncbi:MAG: hypothetical protein O2779_03805 [Nanoarchaeota archaeon]|nr:hypothetical protein [Nanoarchaeota archaeon]
MQALGLTLITLTAIIFAAIGISYARKQHLTAEDYLSSRNSLGLGAAIASLVASGMGAWILFSPAEAAITAGMTALIGYALASALVLFIFAWLGKRLRILMPNGHSLTEYVLHRYGKGMYYIVIIVMLLYMAVFLTAELSGIAQANELVFKTPLIFSTAIIGLATVAYTSLGGLKATLFTDKIQTWFILPLLAIIFIATVSFFGGFSDTMTQVTTTNPDLLNPTNPYGIEYALTLLIAIIGAELFNQGNWQRVYAPKTKKIMSLSFMGAGLIVFAVIMLVGLLGFFAIPTGQAINPSVALFTLLLHATPSWILLTTMVLATTLIMSSMDTLLNGMVSIFAVDIVRVIPNVNKKKLIGAAKAFTLVLAGIAILIASKGYSVLYLFLVADLICVAAVFPTLFGLFNKKYSGTVAIISTIAALIAGAFLFPDPTFARGNLLKSFLVAFFIPVIIAPFAIQSGKDFDFHKLRENVNKFE